MTRIVHEFTVRRKIQGDNTDIALKASFEIEHEIENSKLTGDIFLVDDGIPWSGRLNARERGRAEASAYEAWADENEVDRHHSLRDDACLVDDSFDAFDDDMALKVAGRGMVQW